MKAAARYIVMTLCLCFFQAAIHAHPDPPERTFAGRWTMVNESTKENFALTLTPGRTGKLSGIFTGLDQDHKLKRIALSRIRVSASGQLQFEVSRVGSFSLRSDRRRMQGSFTAPINKRSESVSGQKA